LKNLLLIERRRWAAHGNTGPGKDQDSHTSSATDNCPANQLFCPNQ
jgi:hypothetical protein